jgi:hypothetical protein
MRHTCTHCGKYFLSSTSLDKHARTCRKKWLLLGPPGVRPTDQGPETSRGPKRPQIGRPDEDNEEQPEPSGSNADEVCDLVFPVNRNCER